MNKLYSNKYYINYGGSIHQEELPVAKIIYEFKAGKFALPMILKATKQLINNKLRGQSGLYNPADDTKTKIFRTSDVTKEVIVIYNNDLEYFLPIFIDASLEKKILINIGLNNFTQDDLENITGFCQQINDIIDNFDSNINKDIIVFEEGIFKKIKESQLYLKFKTYIEEVNSVKESLTDFTKLMRSKIGSSILLDKIEERERILLDIPETTYLKIFNKYKEFNPDSKEKIEERTSRVIRKVKKQIKDGNRYGETLFKELDMFNNKKDALVRLIQQNSRIPKERILQMQAKASEYEDKIKEYQDKIMAEDNWFLSFFDSDTLKHFFEIDNLIYSEMYPLESALPDLGRDFEKMIENNQVLRDDLIRISYPESNKTYFGFTWGNSDVDMALI
jgi:hypothetical protein